MYLPVELCVKCVSARVSVSTQGNEAGQGAVVNLSAGDDFPHSSKTT